MTDQERQAAVTRGQLAEVGDWILYALLIALGLGQLPSSTGDEPQLYMLASLIILVRIRILIRAGRMDGLKERLPPDDDTAGKAPGTVPTPCPKCGVVIAVPHDYQHNNVKCAECAHVFARPK